jgi:ClpP class serine protease
LMYRSGSMGADCTELTSYEGLKKHTDDMLEAGVKTIILNVDSSGGMAYGMFAAANYIKKSTKQAGVNTVAYVDGVSYSAAYGLSVLADEIILNPQASVGSVGVVVALYNDSKMLEMAGVTRQFVYAGENKIPFDNKTGEFTESFIADLQKSVNKTYSSFTKHISSYRGLSEQAIIDTQASVFDAEEALELGLADRIMEVEDFELEYGVKTRKKSNSENMYELSGNNQSMKEGTMPDKKVEPKADELLSDTHVNENKVGNKDMSKDVSLKGDLNAQLLELTKENTGMSAQLLELSKKLETSEVEREKLTSIMQEKEAAHRTEQRQLKLEDALGKDNEGIAELLKNTESLSDESFDIVAKSLTGSQVEKQKQLSELGGEGQESEVQLSLTERMKQTAAKMNSLKA